MIIIGMTSIDMPSTLKKASVGMNVVCITQKSESNSNR